MVRWKLNLKRMFRFRSCWGKNDVLKMLHVFYYVVHVEKYITGKML